MSEFQTTVFQQDSKIFAATYMPHTVAIAQSEQQQPMNLQALSTHNEH